MSSERRRPGATRYRVCLSVKFLVAEDFVRQYAENLSAGGLYVPGDHALEPLERVNLEVDLPGLGQHTVVAEVAHVLGRERARELGRRPGVGLMLVEESPEFREALTAYLTRLGRRAEMAVLVGDAGLVSIVADTGYRAALVTSPVDVAHAIAQLEDPLLGVVVPSADVVAYEHALAQAGGGVPVFGMDSPGDLDRVLSALDDEL